MQAIAKTAQEFIRVSASNPSASGDLAVIRDRITRSYERAYE
jgi:hypothetical protein